MSLTSGTLIIAHRGASAKEPENTLRAFRRAFEEGADGVEVDVRASSDGVLVVIHDSSVDRTTNGRGWVRAMKFSELRILDAGKGERIPTLREALELASSYGGLVEVDVKVRGFEREIIEEVKRVGMLDNVFFTSLSLLALREIKRHEPRARIGPLLLTSVLAEVDPVELALKLDASFLHLCDPLDVTEELVERAHSSGLMVFAGTTDDLALLRRLVAMGVNAITPNDPSLGVRAIREALGV